MSIELLKDLKYLTSVFTVVHKDDINNPFYVYINIKDNDQFAIYDARTYNEIMNPEEYSLTKNIMPNDVDEVLCDICSRNDAELVKNQTVYCNNCKDIQQISHNVFKFLNKDDLRKILFALGNEHYNLDEYEKGLVVSYSDSDYDVNHVKIIKSEEIGEF